MDPSLAAMKRTHVVDLNTMTREELIETAKKLSVKIKDKNVIMMEQERLLAENEERINTMTELINSLTSASPAPPSPHDHNETQPIQIQSLKEELENKTQQLTALQNKMNEWKEKVMHISQKDADRIAELEKEVIQLQQNNNKSSNNTSVDAYFGAPAPSAPADIFSPDSTHSRTTNPVDINVLVQEKVQEKLETWKTKTTVRLQEYLDTISRLETEVQQLKQENETLKTQQQTETPSTPVHNADGIPSAELAKIESWKIKVKEILNTNQNTIDTLQSQLTTSEQRVAQLEEELRTAHAAAEANRSKMSEWKSKVKKVVEEGEAEREALRRSLLQMEQQKSSTVVEEQHRDPNNNNNENENPKKEEDTLTEKIAQLEEEKKALQDHLTSREKTPLVPPSLYEEIQTLQETCSRLVGENNRLREDLRLLTAFKEQVDQALPP
ncbi:hypothetical protein, conserved [Angomonas deanei]|uniref:Uncharacterized protein n=1 Tax=Angomonas deanei TaxID=59799 RepID=A0A7G2CUM1_9TRYP|nr:hypothetical protein, conserved [Angomonas deanei]